MAVEISFNPLKAFIGNPLRALVGNPLKALFGNPLKALTTGSLILRVRVKIAEAIDWR